MNVQEELAAARRRNDWNPDAWSGAPPEDVVGNRNEDIERAAATTRYQVFLADGMGGECRPGPLPTTESLSKIANPVLFRKEGGDENAIAMGDVRQGYISDCYLLAPLAGLANSAEGRALIKDAITENKNAAGQVASYTVKLHQPESQWIGKTTFKEVSVTVSATFARDRAVERDASGSKEVWPLVIEKAFAQFIGGYEVLRRGGSSFDALQILTGNPAKQIALGIFRSYGADQLSSDLAAGKIIEFSTRDGLGDNRYALVGGHGYLVTGVENVDGKICVTLFNPVEPDHPTRVPADEIKRWFAWVNIGSAT